MRETFELVTRRDVVVRALRVALLVGTVLIAINHGDRILNSSVAQLDFLKIWRINRATRPVMNSGNHDIKSILQNT